MTIARRFARFTPYSVAAVSWALMLNAPMARAQETPPPAETPTAVPEPPANSELKPFFEEPAEAPKKKKTRRFFPLVGIDFSYYRMTSGVSRERFGDLIGFSVGIGSLERARTNGRWEQDFDFLFANKTDTAAVAVPIGVGYRIALNPAKSSVLPYVGGSVNFVGTWIGSRPDNVQYGFRPAAGFSAFGGVNYQNSGFFEMKYRFISRVRGFELSGLQVSTGVRF